MSYCIIELENLIEKELNFRQKKLPHLEPICLTLELSKLQMVIDAIKLLVSPVSLDTFYGKSVTKAVQLP
jgi:hypothetical protein